MKTSRISSQSKPILKTVFTISGFLFSIIVPPFSGASIWEERKRNLENDQKKTKQLRSAFIEPPVSASSSQKPDFRNPLNIKVPEEYGYVIESWSPGTEGPVVMHIQDAHGYYGAQKNSAAIIKHLYSNSKSKSQETNPLLVCIEGASQRIYPDWLSAFPDETIRNETAESLLKRGIITGEEYLYIREGAGKIRIEGIEDQGIYDANLKSRKLLEDERTLAVQKVNHLQERLKTIKDHIYPSDLISFELAWEKFEKDKIFLNDYVTYLRTWHSGIWNETDCKNLKLFSDISKMEEGGALAGVDQEIKNLISELSEKLDKNTISQLAETSLSHRLNQIRREKYYQVLTNLSSVYKIPTPKIEKYLVYLKKSSEIDQEKIIDEVKMMETAIFESFRKRDPYNSALIDLTLSLRMQEKFWQEQFSPQDWSDYNNRKSTDDLKDIERIVEGQEKKMGITPTLLQRQTTFNIAAAQGKIKLRPTPQQMKYLQEAYYKLAAKRNDALIGNLMQRMKENGTDGKNNQVVLIAGGFHTEGLMHLLKNNKIAYAVIRPKLTAMTDAEGVIARSEATKQSQPLNGNGEIASSPRAPRNDIVAEYLQELQNLKKDAPPEFARKLNRIIDMIEHRLTLSDPIKEADKIFVNGSYQGDRSRINFVMEYVKKTESKEQIVAQTDPALMDMIKAAVGTLRLAPGSEQPSQEMPITTQFLADIKVGSGFELQSMSPTVEATVPVQKPAATAKPVQTKATPTFSAGGYKEMAKMTVAFYEYIRQASEPFGLFETLLKDMGQTTINQDLYKVYKSMAPITGAITYLEDAMITTLVKSLRSLAKIFEKNPQMVKTFNGYIKELETPVGATKFSKGDLNLPGVITILSREDSKTAPINKLLLPMLMPKVFKTKEQEAKEAKEAQSKTELELAKEAKEKTPLELAKQSMEDTEFELRKREKSAELKAGRRGSVDVKDVKAEGGKNPIEEAKKNFEAASDIYAIQLLKALEGLDESKYNDVFNQLLDMKGLHEKIGSQAYNALSPNVLAMVEDYTTKVNKKESVSRDELHRLNRYILAEIYPQKRMLGQRGITEFAPFREMVHTVAKPSADRTNIKEFVDEKMAQKFIEVENRETMPFLPSEIDVFKMNEYLLQKGNQRVAITDIIEQLLKDIYPTDDTITAEQWAVVLNSVREIPDLYNKVKLNLGGFDTFNHNAAELYKKAKANQMLSQSEVRQLNKAILQSLYTYGCGMHLIVGKPEFTANSIVYHRISGSEFVVQTVAPTEIKRVDYPAVKTLSRNQFLEFLQFLEKRGDVKSKVLPGTLLHEEHLRQFMRLYNYNKGKSVPSNFQFEEFEVRPEMVLTYANGKSKVLSHEDKNESEKFTTTSLDPDTMDKEIDGWIEKQNKKLEGDNKIAGYTIQKVNVVVLTKGGLKLTISDNPRDGDRPIVPDASLNEFLPYLTLLGLRQYFSDGIEDMDMQAVVTAYIKAENERKGPKSPKQIIKWEMAGRTLFFKFKDGTRKKMVFTPNGNAEGAPDALFVDPNHFIEATWRSGEGRDETIVQPSALRRKVFLIRTQEESQEDRAYKADEKNFEGVNAVDTEFRNIQFRAGDVIEELDKLTPEEFNVFMDIHRTALRTVESIEQAIRVVLTKRDYPEDQIRMLLASARKHYLKTGVLVEKTTIAESAITRIIGDDMKKLPQEDRDAILDELDRRQQELINNIYGLTREHREKGLYSSQDKNGIGEHLKKSLQDVVSFIAFYRGAMKNEKIKEVDIHPFDSLFTLPDSAQSRSFAEQVTDVFYSLMPELAFKTFRAVNVLQDVKEDWKSLDPNAQAQILKKVNAEFGIPTVSITEARDSSGFLIPDLFLGTDTTIKIKFSEVGLSVALPGNMIQQLGRLDSLSPVEKAVVVQRVRAAMILGRLLQQTVVADAVQLMSYAAQPAAAIKMMTDTIIAALQKEGITRESLKKEIQTIAGQLKEPVSATINRTVIEVIDLNGEEKQKSKILAIHKELIKKQNQAGENDKILFIIASETEESPQKLAEDLGIPVERIILQVPTIHDGINAMGTVDAAKIVISPDADAIAQYKQLKNKSLTFINIQGLIDVPIEKLSGSINQQVVELRNALIQA